MVLSGPPPDPATTRVSRTTGMPERSRRATGLGFVVSGFMVDTRRPVPPERPLLEGQRLGGPSFPVQAIAFPQLSFRRALREPPPHHLRERLGGINQVEAIAPVAGGRQRPYHDGPPRRQVFLQF